MSLRDHNYITTVGPAVLDGIVRPPTDRTAGYKRDCDWEDGLGGGAVNVAVQVANLGMPVVPVLLTGQDALRPTVDEMARQQFKSAICAPLLQQTRRSVLLGDDCYTLRAGLIEPKLPDDLRRVIASSRLTVVAPLSAEDARFAKDVLQSARQSVLMLSNQQSQIPAQATELARKAWLVVVNQPELVRWTGIDDVQQGIMWLREEGVKNIVVTSRGGCTAWIEGNWYHQRSFVVDSARETVGAGDRFVGTLVSAIAADQPWGDAIHLAQAAAALHVEGNAAAGDGRALEAAVSERALVPFQPPRRPRPPRRVAAYSAATAATLLVSALIGWWA